MKKNGFTIVEVVVVFLLMLGVTFFILPMSLDTTKQARFISKWTGIYTEVDYMFSVIKAQKDDEINRKFLKTQNNQDREQIILETIKPYLRISSEVEAKNYIQYYMNGMPVGIGDRYHFDNFYYENGNDIIGLKWLVKTCKPNVVCGIIAFDLNGLEEPNTWGYDIFGINVLKDKIEPIGKGIDETILKDDCTKHGTGLYCSNYYLIGGNFE